MKRILFLILVLSFYSSFAIAFSVGTYNVWHGLNGLGKVSIGELEDFNKRRSREDSQNEYFKELTGSVDILFLQEVNPVYSRSQKWSEVTEKDSISGVANCGVKIGSLGVPTNLYSGLTILANKNYKLTKIAAHALSGSGLVLPPLLCAHFSERRIALFATVTIPNQGRTLLVNVHLHHKHGLTKYYKDFLRRKLDNGYISNQEYNQLVNRAQSATERRKNEISKLIGYISEYKKKFSIEKVIVAGDFNMDVYRSGENLQLFEDRTGLVFPLGSIPNYYSWWPEENSNRNYILNFVSDELESNSNITENMKQILLEEEEKPRLIDLIYVSKGFLQGQPSLFSPIGFDKGLNDRHFSDHFGYSLDFSL